MNHQVFTTGQIAEQSGVRREQVAYAIHREGIEPVGRAGIVRLFGEGQIGAIREGLYNIQIRGAQCVK